MIDDEVTIFTLVTDIDKKLRIIHEMTMKRGFSFSLPQNYNFTEWIKDTRKIIKDNSERQETHVTHTNVTRHLYLGTSVARTFYDRFATREFFNSITFDTELLVRGYSIDEDRPQRLEDSGIIDGRAENYLARTLNE